jgi:hypothetical protein
LEPVGLRILLLVDLCILLLVDLRQGKVLLSEYITLLQSSAAQLRCFLAKAGLLNFLSEKRFLCGNPRGHLQLLQNQPVDVLHRNAALFRRLLLDVAIGGTWVFLNKSLKGHGLVSSLASQSPFSSQEFAEGQVLCLVQEAKDGRPVVAEAVGDDFHRDSLLSPG